MWCHQISNGPLLLRSLQSKMNSGEQGGTHTNVRHRCFSIKSTWISHLCFLDLIHSLQNMMTTLSVQSSPILRNSQLSLDFPILYSFFQLFYALVSVDFDGV
uniref:Uncharacterized protein n=1 Tax=Micrurus carvalhoi TaxID=3147026 RepID=A0A2H6NF99_9SAUR